MPAIFEPRYFTYFVHNGHSKDFPDAGNGDKKLVLRSLLGSGQYRGFQLGDLLGEEVDALELEPCMELYHGVLEPLLEVLFDGMFDLVPAVIEDTLSEQQSSQ